LTRKRNGGGSTEFIRVEPGRALAALSLQIGSVRLTERHIHHDPPAVEELAAMSGTIDAAIDSLSWSSYRPDLAVGIAGTVTTVCAIALGLQNYDHAIVHGHRLTREKIAEVLKLLASLPVAERRKLPGIVQGREDVIVAGATILDRICAYFDLAAITVSDQGVRWGLIWQQLDRLAIAGNTEPR
jgi:exopolyphosphatase/guanosine-5'-triphosphate,3'-diphosphate pyrophosphatase